MIYTYVDDSVYHVDEYVVTQQPQQLIAILPKIVKNGIHYGSAILSPPPPLPPPLSPTIWPPPSLCIANWHMYKRYIP